MPAEFPGLWVNAANPHPLFYEEDPEEFVVDCTIYDDNGADWKLQHGGSGRKVWRLMYGGLLAAQAAIIDAWVATMFYSPDKGSAYGANFRAHIPGEAYTSTNGTLYSGVHIAPGGYKKDHIKSWANSRELILEKRP